MEEIDEVLPSNIAACPPHDLQVPLMSLPRIMKTNLQTIPSYSSYLSVNAGKISEWADRFAPLVGLKVGLFWQGNPAHVMDARRSISLRLFDKLSGLKNMVWINLQEMTPETKDKLLESPLNLVHFGSHLNTWIDIAACILQCDLVIGVDSSIAHLAGSLGKPVWLLLHTPPDWRWFLDREDTPWYPKTRLIRQEIPSDWTTVIDKVQRELQECLR
jgi:hypothetical protein